MLEMCHSLYMVYNYRYGLDLQVGPRGRSLRDMKLWPPTGARSCVKGSSLELHTDQGNLSSYSVRCFSLSLSLSLSLSTHKQMNTYIYIYTYTYMYYIYIQVCISMRTCLCIWIYAHVTLAIIKVATHSTKTGNLLTTQLVRLGTLKKHNNYAHQVLVGGEALCAN